jgi:hypothetical protein
MIKAYSTKLKSEPCLMTRQGSLLMECFMELASIRKPTTGFDR